MDRDRILLTPGPLTTTLRTKLAMLKDWGSWDGDFIAITARVRERLLDIVHGQGSHVVVPLQGSGTFSVEAAVATVVPRDGHVLVPDNGAYCKRAAKLTQMMGRRATVLPVAEDQPISAEAVAAALPIDARTTRFDALIAASGKCLEGVPGMGFVFIRQAVLDGCAGHSQSLAMDLFDQHQYMEKTGQWRFTPPTHVVVALAEAITQFVEEGGQPARLARYAANCATLVDGMRQLGLKPFLKPEHQAPIIVTFHAPAHPAYDFQRFYQAAKRRGFMLYPGKLTTVDTFRVGCIGAIGGLEMQQAVNAVGETLREMGLTTAPA